MSLEKWLSENRLAKHKTSKQEIQNLFALVERDIQDAEIDAISNDRRFITAYNAALQLATCALYLSGYKTKPSKGGHHWINFAVLPDILGDGITEYSAYFDTCRVKRNLSDYTSSGVVSLGETEELISEVSKFKGVIQTWIQKNTPEYL
jgi:hypothetical protein